MIAAHVFAVEAVQRTVAELVFSLFHTLIYVILESHPDNAQKVAIGNWEDCILKTERLGDSRVAIHWLDRLDCPNPIPNFEETKDDEENSPLSKASTMPE